MFVQCKKSEWKNLLLKFNPRSYVFGRIDQCVAAYTYSRLLYLQINAGHQGYPRRQYRLGEPNLTLFVYTLVFICQLSFCNYIIFFN